MSTSHRIVSAHHTDQMVRATWETVHVKCMNYIMCDICRASKRYTTVGTEALNKNSVLRYAVV
jgi:hypothetical protein